MERPNSSPGGAVLLKAFLIATAVLAIYSPVFHGDWLWDDGTLILKNHNIHDAGGLAAIWRGPINGTEFLPMTSSVEWLEWHLWGDRTLGYHLVSILLHLASALLVWRLLARLGVASAWIGGLLFAIHPLAVESVAWIAELKNTLSLPPFLLALCAWIDYDRSGSRRDYLLALAWFLLAMLCKPTVLMFPAVILLYAWWRRGRIGGRDARAAAPILAVALALGLLAALLSRSGVEPSSATTGTLAGIATAGWELLIFAGKCFLPIHLLPLYPSRWVASPSVLDLMPWLFVAGVLLLLWRKRDGWGRHTLLGVGFFLLNLVPVLGFIAGNAATMVWSLDHLVYLPLIGIVGLAAAAWDAIGLHRAWMVAVAGLTLALLAARSHAYAFAFTDEESLWTATLAGNPGSAIAHNNLGRFYLDKHKVASAAEQFRAAIRLKPDYAYAHNGLGNALALIGKPGDAVAEYHEALKSDPDYPEAHNGLANLLLQSGRLDEARAECELALRNRPGYVDALCNLGLIDLQQGNTADAIRQFENAQKLQPNDKRIDQLLLTLKTKPAGR